MNREDLSDQPPCQPDPVGIQKQRVEDATDFLSNCDGTGHPAFVHRNGGPSATIVASIRKMCNELCGLQRV